MKVIFLDIDGVMVTKNCLTPGTWRYKNKSEKYGVPMFDPESANRLNQIIKATGAKIVLSSTWRKWKGIKSIIRENGFKMIGKTPVLDTIRGEEINEWLKSFKVGSEVESFVILDDDDDMGELLSHLVQTSWETGITDEHVKQAIEILNRDVKQ